MRRLKSLAFAALVLSTGGCGSLDAGGSVGNSQKPASPDVATKVATFVKTLDTLRQKHRIPGVSVAVLKDRELILARGLGVADIEQQTPATAQTPYDIASVSKPLSAVVALKLVEQGVVDLDRPIAEYSEWLAFCQEFSKQPSIFAKDLQCDSPVHTLRHLLSHTATGRPGERFSYNPVLFSWASRPISAAAADPFSSLVVRHVFEPAGMSRSARRHRNLALPEALAAALAPPHRTDEAGTVVRAPAPGPQGDGAAGGVISTVEDLARFDVALDEDRLVSAASRTSMMTPQRNVAGDPLPYGLGWYLQPYRGHTLVWHSGWWEQAYSALYLKVPDAGLTLILLANSEGVWWGNPLDRAEVERSPFAAAFLDAFLPAAERVSFPTSDGGVVYADVYGGGTHGVVLAHGGRFNKESWSKQARMLAAAGLRVVAIDFRGYGESRGPGQADPLRAPLHLDVLAAVRYLRQSGATTVSVVGGSMGGSAAADASVDAAPGGIDRLVLLGSDAGRTPARVRGRKLFITARDDLAASGTPRLVRIREHYGGTPEPKELVVLEGSAHAQFIFQTDQSDRLMEEILRFLSEKE